MSQAHPDVPQPSVRRLSQYLRQLESLHDQHQRTVSSRSLAASLDLTDAQVRKDLAYFGQFGRPGVGYEVGPLIHRLRSILGTDRVSYTLLVGVGNIGRALARYQGFTPKGFQLVALFDADPKKVGKKIGSMPIQPMEEIESVVQHWHVRLAIVAVPAEHAQGVLDRLAGIGIRGILNFAPTRLKAPTGVTVHNLDVAAELEQLSYMANHSPADPA